MIYLYDEAICRDIQESFAVDENNEPIVRVVAPDAIIALNAQMQSDVIKFPLISVERDGWSIDNNRTNFTTIHRGQLSNFDSKNNNLYYERALPINIKYTITVMAESLIDTDELIRELLFKYYDTYFLEIKLPYESDRIIRFGIQADVDAQINRSVATLEYLQSGKINQTSLDIYTQGCILLHYKERHLMKLGTDKLIHVKDTNGNEVETD